MRPEISRAVVAGRCREMQAYAASRRQAAATRRARPGRRLLSFIRIPGPGYSPRTRRALGPLHDLRAA